MAKQPVSTSPVWQLSQIGVPVDIIDMASVGTLMWSIQPIANCLSYLYDWLTVGVFKVRLAASVAALKALQANDGDVRMLTGYGLYVFVSGAGFEETTVDVDPLWFRSTSISVGRWQHVGAYLLGTTPNRAPRINADGRLDVLPVNGISGVFHVGEVQPEVTGTGVLSGSLSCGAPTAGSKILVTARAYAFSDGDKSAVYSLRISENGSPPVVITQAYYKQTAGSAHGSVAMSFMHTIAVTGAAVFTVSVNVTGGGSSFATAIQNIDAVVIQP